jgi:hypothetical protein
MAHVRDFRRAADPERGATHARAQVRVLCFMVHGVGLLQVATVEPFNGVLLERSGGGLLLSTSSK